MKIFIYIIALIICAGIMFSIIACLPDKDNSGTIETIKVTDIVKTPEIEPQAEISAFSVPMGYKEVSDLYLIDSNGKIIAIFLYQADAQEYRKTLIKRDISAIIYKTKGTLKGAD